MEGLYSGDVAAQRDRRLLVWLPAEQELKDALEAHGQGYGGTAEGGTGTDGNAKGERSL